MDHGAAPQNQQWQHTATGNHDFPDNSARYVRVVGHGNTQNDWTSITEATVNGADASDDVSVFRLENNKLYITNGDNKHKLVTDNYVLGTKFQAKFVVGDGQIKAYFNGVLQATISKSFSGGYFKAGAYTQANCDNSSPCSQSNYGEVKVYSLTVSHNG